MSGFDNVVGGKLKLKGKALDVKAGGMKKKKKHKKNISLVTETELSAGEGTGLANESNKEEATNENKMGGEEKATNENKVGGEEKATNENKMGGEEKAPSYDDHLTPAERRYIEERERIYVKRLAKTANKSHRDRIQDFNQYLANMSEHYDIPKVGPG